MSYLSRRMREDGWPRRKPGVLTVTFHVDTTRAEAACERAIRAIDDLVERLGLPPLTPWQSAIVEAMYPPESEPADPSP